MKILICCNAGMSSSIIMKKMKDAAEKRNMELTCEAVPNAGISDEIGKWDVCLVGPQLVYAVNKPVASIEPRVYALADGDKALDFAIELAKKS